MWQFQAEVLRQVSIYYFKLFNMDAFYRKGLVGLVKHGFVSKSEVLHISKIQKIK